MSKWENPSGVGGGCGRGNYIPSAADHRDMEIYSTPASKTSIISTTDMPLFKHSSNKQTYLELEQRSIANILFTSQVSFKSIGLSVIKGHNTSPVMDAGHSTAQVRVMGQYVSPQNTFVCPCYVRCCGNEVILEIGFLFHTPDQRPSDTWLSSISRFHIVRKCIPFQKFFICPESIQFEPHISNNRSNVKRIDII